MGLFLGHSFKQADLVEFADNERPTDADEVERLVLDEMNACVRGVIDGLPPSYRAAIVLFNLAIAYYDVDDRG